MFRWYKQSHVCFVFLSDLLSIDRNKISSYLPNCRWFTRGWTLQELIAPSEIEFYDWGWNLIGTNGDDTLRALLSEITGIDANVLDDSDLLQSIPVARRMSWAASRQTTRVEDLAYCLFGIFDVNLPLIYGEGKKSFIRLQEAIASETNDLSLFAWTSQNEDSVPLSRRQRFRGILAHSPAEFRGCDDLQNISNPGVIPAVLSITNQGFNIADRLLDGGKECLLSLDCFLQREESRLSTIVIRLVRTPYGYVRQHAGVVTGVNMYYLNNNAFPSLPIPKTISPAETEAIGAILRERFSFDYTTNIQFLDVQIQKKPLHLWDHATKTFITGGSPVFTGVIELSATWSENRSRCCTRWIVIFGLRSAYNSSKDHLKRASRLEPWARLYTDRQGSDESRIITNFLAKEDDYGFPHVAGKARTFALTPSFDQQQFSTTSKQIDILVGLDRVPYYASKGDRWIESTLFGEMEKTSDFSIYKMQLNLKKTPRGVI